MHTVGQDTEEGHRGLALDTLRVTGQRQHGKQPTASHRQHKSSTYVSGVYLYIGIIIYSIQRIIYASTLYFIFAALL